MLEVLKMAKTKTSTEVKNRWNAKTYKRYTLSLRKESDEKYITFIEQAKSEDIGVTELFKRGLDLLMKE